tara:strand:- start:263 stop:553 length:291 start_codon:yes stop_codon:yes gene_type:complete
MNTNEPTHTYDVLHSPLARITEFQLTLGGGTEVTIPCSGMSNHNDIAVLAAAIHHLIQRVADLEANREEHMRKVYPQLFPDLGVLSMTTEEKENDQ